MADASDTDAGDSEIETNGPPNVSIGRNQPAVVNIERWRLFNIVLLGVAFMFMFTAFQTCSNIEQIVLESFREENGTNGTSNKDSFSKGAGYTSLAIIYAVFALSNWLAPSVVAVVTAKWSMVIGGIIYGLFIASFLKPMQWLLYLTSVLIGFGAAVIWTGQGNFLTVNSGINTVGRNSGIFWALFQSSMLFGNLFVYFVFGDQKTIDDHARVVTYLFLTVASILGILLLLPLRTKFPTHAEEASVNDSSSQIVQPQQKGPLAAFKKSLQLFFTRDMMLLSLTFAYTGFELTFFSGVYGTIVGHTLHTDYIGLVGISVGVGEILGGATFGLMGKRTNKYGRDPIVLLGFLVHLAAFYLCFLSFPADSPLQAIKPSHSNVYVTPQLYIALIGGFLLGLGDSSFNTQLFSLLGYVYSESSAPAFALYKFVQSLAAAAGFFYSTHLLLHWQLLILVVFNVMGTLGFFVVEWKANTATNMGYARI